MRKSSELKTIRAALLSGVGLVLSPHGFLARGEVFCRTQESVIQGIVLDIATYPDVGLSIGVSAAIRFLEVESIANECGDGDGESWTIGSARYQSKKWHRIAKQKQVEGVIREVARWVEQDGLQFLERHSSVSEISEVLSSDSEAAALLQPIPLARAIRSIAMGLVDGGPDVTLERIEYWRGELLEKYPEYCRWFEEWINRFNESVLSGSRASEFSNTNEQ